MVSGVGSNASVMLAASTSALKKSVDANENVITELLDSISSGEVSGSSDGALDIYA